MEKLKNTRILGLVGIICLFLGTVLPFIGSSKLKLWISLYNYWEGKVVLVLILANTLFIFKDYVEKYAPQLFSKDFGVWIKNANQKFVLIPTCIMGLLELYLMNTVGIFSRFAGVLDFGIGLYLSILGTICLFGHCFIYKNPNGNNVSNTMNGNYSNNMNQMNNNYNNQMMNNQNNMNSNFNNNYNNPNGMNGNYNNSNNMNNNYNNQQQNNMNNNQNF